MVHALKAKNLGTTPNHFHLLNPDLTKFYPQKFLDLTKLNPTVAAKKIGISRPNFYKDEISLAKNEKLTKKIMEFIVSADLAFELLGENKKETLLWLSSPNTAFFGDTPLEICLRGEGRRLIEWLLTRLGKGPGIGL